MNNTSAYYESQNKSYNFGLNKSPILNNLNSKQDPNISDISPLNPKNQSQA